MKKSFLILLLLVLISYVRGNIATPQAYISEILVDSAGNWTIEMGFYEWSVIEIDSIMLETSTGSSIITYFTIIPGGGQFDSLAVITNANLANPVVISSEGDFVKLISYAWGDDPFDYVAFGNYAGSQIVCILGGESVCYVSYVQSAGYTGSFCIDMSPTIGVSNDTTGALGTITGVIYTPSGIPFSNGVFFLWELPNTKIYIDTTGFYSERVFSRRYTFDTIQRWIYSPYAIETYTTEPVDFCLRPDSSHYQDIITTSLVMDTKEKEEDVENVVVISPNPFSDKVVFYFNLKNGDPSVEMSFSIYSLDGREIDRITLSPDQKRYEWIPGGTVSPGTLIYRLEKNSKTLKSGKFIKM